MTDVSVNQSRFVKQYPGQHKRTGECSRCDKPRAPSSRYCNSCHAAYMRDWRKTHPMTPEQRRKDNCRSYAGVYQRRGKIIPQPCKRCKAEKAEKHHPDYGQPLNVIWLCRPCHLLLHRMVEERKARMKRFVMYRRNVLTATHDENQRNAPDEPQFEGVVFDDGKVAIRWLTAKRSTACWDSMDDMLAIHGHPEYGSELIWLDAA